jgi:hypothetical protein
MNIDFSDVITRIGTMNKQELDAVFNAYKMRHKTLRTEAALTNQATLLPGTRVITQNLRPKYLNDLHGVVGDGNARRAGDLQVIIDESDRFLAERYVSSVTGIVNVPAASLRKE